ncbi:MAG: hypothetical protein RL648_749 [Verrucomicrobiota bacterium]
MVRVVKRKLHQETDRAWRLANFAERLEAVEAISGIKKGKDAQPAFPSVYRITRKK